MGADTSLMVINPIVRVIDLISVGGGSRLKILEALACGLPVVSTTVGAEGLRLTAGVHYACANTMTKMAQTLLGWIRDRAPALALARAGREVVERQYDWAMVADGMERAWEGLLRRPQTVAPIHSV